MVIYKTSVVETPAGFVAVAAKNGELHRSTLPHATRQAALATLKAGLAVSHVEDEAAFGELPERMKRYFAGERVDFSDVLLDTRGYPPFHAAAILAAQKIPYGEVVTYAQLARSAGSEHAARAVGNAMAMNRTPIIVPCHRVVAANSGLGGFSGGLEWKRELLELEGVSI